MLLKAIGLAKMSKVSISIPRANTTHLSIPFIKLAHLVVDAVVCGAKHVPYFGISQVLKRHAYGTLLAISYSPSTCANDELKKHTHFFNSKKLLFFSHSCVCVFCRGLIASKQLPMRLVNLVNRRCEPRTYRSFNSIRASLVDG